MKPQVLVTRQIPEKALNVLKENCEVDLNEPDQTFTAEELKARLQGKVGMVCLITDKISESILEAGRDLKVVANVAVGYDNIDLKAATRRKIMVTNTPGVLTETTADLAWALILAIGRRIVEGDRYVRAHRWKEWGLQLFLGSDIHGKTLGILGMGRIGQAVAKRGLGFGMRILYHNRHRLSEEIEKEYRATYVDKETLLREADFLSIHVPLNAETTHAISAKDLSLMKPTAYLINTARGPIVHERNLIEALRTGRIAGAGLDVFEEEPKVPEELMELENIVLLPHVGSASVETRTKMALMAAENLVVAVAGERPPNLINPEVL
ncbi:MAG: D-glycerate dehydrogenase, partial [Candidatus Tectomicrobia bacterium]|nr:D-glycerate dehydrogenase [Candidatus Tectomicrobia bacterium]